MADSIGKGTLNFPRLSLANLVSFVIFLEEFLDYASRGGTQGLLDCIAEDTKVAIKLHATQKFPHLAQFKTVQINKISEIQFLEITLLRFSTASESDKCDIKKHLKSIKMSSEKSHLFGFDQFQKFIAAILHAINIFRNFMTDLTDKYYAKLISDGVSPPIQKFAKEHAEQVGPAFSLDDFLLVLCAQAETLRLAEPTIEWTHANALKMAAAATLVENHLMEVVDTREDLRYLP
jgi:hypothetical protein